MPSDEALLRRGTAKHIAGEFPRTLWTVTDGEFVSTGTQEIEPSSMIPVHSHSAPEAEEVLTCIRGSGRIVVGDETHPFQPGQPWLIPRNVPHSIINNSSTESLWLNWSISPAMSVASLTQDSRAHGDQALVAERQTVSVEDFQAKGFAVVPDVFEPDEMHSLGVLISSLADQHVQRINRDAQAGKIHIGGLDGVRTDEEYLAYQRANPETWLNTVAAMSAVQVREDGSLMPRKLNFPIKTYSMTPGTPNGGAFKAVALDPRITSLASQLLGGRPVMVFSDQAFLKPPEGGGPKPFHQDNW